MVAVGDLAWLAGILEGEGTITLGKHKVRVSYNPIVSFSNTDEAIIREGQRIIAEIGSVPTTLSVENSRIGKKPIWRVQVTSFDGVERVLAAVLPYMKSAKCDKAALLLQFVRERQGKKRLGGLARCYTSQEIHLAEVIRMPKRA